jgi:hypothetical protein
MVEDSLCNMALAIQSLGEKTHKQFRSSKALNQFQVSNMKVSSSDKAHDVREASKSVAATCSLEAEQGGRKRGRPRKNPAILANDNQGGQKDTKSMSSDPIEHDEASQGEAAQCSLSAEPGRKKRGRPRKLSGGSKASDQTDALGIPEAKRIKNSSIVQQHQSIAEQEGEGKENAHPTMGRFLSRNASPGDPAKQTAVPHKQLQGQEIETCIENKQSSCRVSEKVFDPGCPMHVSMAKNLLAVSGMRKAQEDVPFGRQQQYLQLNTSLKTCCNSNLGK